LDAAADQGDPQRPWAWHRGLEARCRTKFFPAIGRATARVRRQSQSAGRALHALGRAVRELRARRDLSQEELGYRSSLHRNYVGTIERGEINPTFRVLLKLSRGLSIPLSELMTLYKSRREGVRPVQPSALTAARPEWMTVGAHERSA
jgi:ribosome-binding protein aMBF1 (putative translation factor)